ncbi:uncharacterized protein N7479_002439 [Penicillium vulpinum]|uniref:uncharacterized protein n=1 Tax=Penicillium vulpinum TaxID=29845 RepID=UPI0025477B90|nr:uncharacterized protein N7479_002439 [Penicillium vulpinum]KAJ5972521.1 hypothetical protein N7479_002439 [Penicillium vulpinum]
MPSETVETQTAGILKRKEVYNDPAVRLRGLWARAGMGGPTANCQLPTLHALHDITQCGNVWLMDRMPQLDTESTRKQHLMQGLALA